VSRTPATAALLLKWKWEGGGGTEETAWSLPDIIGGPPPDERRLLFGEKVDSGRGGARREENHCLFCVLSETQK